MFRCSVPCLVLILLLSACDAYHEQHFVVRNELKTPVLLHFEIGGKIDSLINIPTKTEVEIFKYGGIFGMVGVSDDRYVDDLSNLRFENKETVLHLDESLWKFEKLSKYHAVSTITIDESLLQ